MIHVNISNRGKEDRIRFPCTEGELSRKLEEIGAYGAQEAPHFYIEKGNRPQRVCRFGRAVCRPGCVKLSGKTAGRHGRKGTETVFCGYGKGTGMGSERVNQPDL